MDTGLKILIWSAVLLVGIFVVPLIIGWIYGAITGDTGERKKGPIDDFDLWDDGRTPEQKLKDRNEMLNEPPEWVLSTAEKVERRSLKKTTCTSKECKTPDWL